MNDEHGIGALRLGMSIIGVGAGIMLAMIFAALWRWGHPWSALMFLGGVITCGTALRILMKRGQAGVVMGAVKIAAVLVLTLCMAFITSTLF